jgi:hypothetical protein
VLYSSSLEYDIYEARKAKQRAIRYIRYGDSDLPQSGWHSWALAAGGILSSSTVGVFSSSTVGYSMVALARNAS